MVLSCRRKRLFHYCMFNMLFSIAGHWKPMGVKIHWEIQKGTKMETNGDEKPLGNHKKTKNNKMWRPMALDPTIGLHILFFFCFFKFPSGFSPPLVSTFWFFFVFPNGFSPPLVSTSCFFVFPMAFQFPLVSTFNLFSFFVSPRVFDNHWFPMLCKGEQHIEHTIKN